MPLVFYPYLSVMDANPSIYQVSFRALININDFRQQMELTHHFCHKPKLLAGEEQEAQRVDPDTEARPGVRRQNIDNGWSDLQYLTDDRNGRLFFQQKHNQKTWSSWR